MEEKKNNKGLVWLIVVLIILVLGLVGYIVYDKVLLKDKMSVSNNEMTTTKINSEENNDYFIIETKTSKTGINVTLSQKTSNNSCNLLIDNKKIDLDINYCFESQFNLYDNFIIIISYSANLPITHDVLIIDYNGKKLTSANNMIVEQNNYINNTNDFYHLYYIDNIEVDNNKIKYNIEYHNDLCIFQGYNTDEGDNCGIMEMKCSDIEELGENINSISTYEIDLIDNKFSTPKLISSTKLKDTDVYKKAINSCE